MSALSDKNVNKSKETDENADEKVDEKDEKSNETGSHPSWAQEIAPDDRANYKEKSKFKMWGDVCVPFGWEKDWEKQFIWPCCKQVGFKNEKCTNPKAVDPNKKKVDKDEWRKDKDLVKKWEALDPDPKTCNGRCKFLDNPLPASFMPCFRANVTGTSIPAGQRAGARPCGSMYRVRTWLYCHKCYVRSQLESGIAPDKIEW